jgi:DNA-binding transcriptional ArsR family regulator
MQPLLPFFPPSTKFINSSVGFREQDGTVYYFLNGSPFYFHGKEDMNGYRYCLANLVVQRLCKICELCVALGEGRKNIERWSAALRDHGIGHFFARKERRGQCYKMTVEKLDSIQRELDKGVSIYRTSLNHKVSESAISYHIKNGNLKKKK